MIPIETATESPSLDDLDEVSDSLVSDHDILKQILEEQPVDDDVLTQLTEEGSTSSMLRWRRTIVKARK